MKKDNQRLSEHITASNYSIIIEPSKDMQTYAGKVTIKAEITKPTKEIQLHSKNSEIKTSNICIGTQCLLPKLKENKESETITIELQKEIKGDIEIHIEFEGKITEDLAGIYRSKYEHSNKTHYLITTQCEAPYARRIFPCFDEPNKKATFDLKVIINQELRAVSNMLPKSESIQGNKKTVQFKTTPKMSTYLFYLGIGDFEFAEDNYKNIKLRIVTTKGKSKNTKFALEHTKKYIEYFENYSEIPYPLEKLDLLAIPDFTVAGMENWGAITFRELILLIDEEKSSAARKTISAEEISHDLWDSLNEISKDKKVKEMMKYWISQTGYPIVSIEKKQQGLKLSQERCNKKTNQIWPIPLSICTENICHNKLLEKKEETYNIKEKYIKANHEQFGFYRTKYSKELLNNIAIMIKEKKLNEQDRWGVNNDLWALCNIEEESLETYIQFLESYKSETIYIILADIYSSIRKLDRLFYYESWWPKSKKKITDNFMHTFKFQIEKLGWNNLPDDTTDDKSMRNLCISFCGFANDKETITEAQARYAKDDFSLDIANSIYFIVAKNGNEKTFKNMLEKYEKSNDPESKIRLLSGLYHFSNNEIVEKALNYSLTEKVRSQDLLYVFRNIFINPISQKIILKWCKNNWKNFKKHEDNHYLMREFLDTLIISQTTEQGKKEVQEFIEKNKITYEMTKANSFEILDQNIKFIEKNKDFLENY